VQSSQRTVQSSQENRAEFLGEPCRVLRRTVQSSQENVQSSEGNLVEFLVRPRVPGVGGFARNETGCHRPSATTRKNGVDCENRRAKLRLFNISLKARVRRLSDGLKRSRHRPKWWLTPICVWQELGDARSQRSTKTQRTLEPYGETGARGLLSVSPVRPVSWTLSRARD